MRADKGATNPALRGYRERRDAMLKALAETLPDAEVLGIAAGLHAAVRLPAGDDERAIVEEADRRGLAIVGLDKYRSRPGSGAPTILINYGRHPPATIRRGIMELGAVVRATRRRG